MSSSKGKDTAKARIIRGLVEVAFIIFLFYSNLLMGEFTRSGSANGKGLLWAITDVFTENNFIIAIIAAVAGQGVFYFLRKKV